MVDYLRPSNKIRESLSGLGGAWVRVDRKVEMYQWDEEVKTTKEKQLGGSTKKTKRTSYVKKWSDELINHNNFRKPQDHVNPQKRIKSRTTKSKSAWFGNYHA